MNNHRYSQLLSMQDSFVDVVNHYLNNYPIISFSCSLAKEFYNVCRIRRHMIKMVLGNDQLYYVSLSEDRHSIRLAIIPDENGIVTPQGLQERWKLMEYFNTKLMETVKVFMPASDLPQRFIPCSKCSTLHLRLEDLRAKNKVLHCLHGKLPKDYYSDLKQYQGSYICT